MARTKDNRSYWESVGRRYNDGWTHPAMAAMGQREMDFVSSVASRIPARCVLDIGIGNGRIIDTLLGQRAVERVYGIDIAEAMVNVCREKYAQEPRVKGLAVCNLPTEGLPFEEEFDFVSAVRVLKYNPDWRGVLPQISARLRPDGLFLFTMPNRDSLNRYSRYPVSTYTTTREEVAAACAESALRVVEVTSFSKIPSRAYQLSRSLAYRDVVLKVEDLLDASLGRARFGRELFVVAARSERGS